MHPHPPSDPTAPADADPPADGADAHPPALDGSGLCPRGFAPDQVAAVPDSPVTNPFGPALGSWGRLLGPLLEGSLALAIGRFTLQGEPLYLSPGMRAVVGGDSPDRPRRDYLVNPSFARLLSAAPSGLGEGRSEALVFSGWLTIGDGHRQERSLRGRVYRRDDELLVMAEYDVAELERLERELSRTNQDICNLQRDLVRKNVRLEQSLSEVERQLQALRDSERRLRLIVEHIADPVMVTDAAGRIRSVNPAFTRVTGYQAAEVQGHTPRLLASGRHAPDFYADMRAQLAKTGQWRGIIWNRRKDGLLLVQRLSISGLRDSSGEDLFVAVYNDIGQEIEALERAQFLAEHDALTGLPNRVLLFDRLSEALVDARTRRHLVAVMLIDLDRFKPINDTHGHAIGDAVLQIAARRMGRTVRSTDTVARLGGDEFVVVLRDLPSRKPAFRAAQLLTERLGRPLRLSEQLRLRVGASIGIAFGPRTGEGPEGLLERADAAMYEVKRTNHQGDGAAPEGGRVRIGAAKDASEDRAPQSRTAPGSPASHG